MAIDLLVGRAHLGREKLVDAGDQQQLDLDARVLRLQRVEQRRADCVRPERNLLGFQVGCLSTVLIAINNLRDRDEDAGTGKRTLAVRFGVTWAKREIMWLCYAPWIIGALCWNYLGSNVTYWIAPGVIFALLAVVSPVLRTPPSARYNRILAFAGAQLILFALLFTFGSLADRYWK